MTAAEKNYIQRLLENTIEITWIFDNLEESGKIKSFDEIIKDIPTGSDDIKDLIMDMANKYELTLEMSHDDVDYLDDIQKFAEERIIKEYGIDHTYRVMVTQSGYADVEAKTPEEAIQIAKKVPLSYFDWTKDQGDVTIVEED